MLKSSRIYKRRSVLLSLSMVDAVKVVRSRRWCCRSPRRLLLWILVVISVLSVYYKNISETLTHLSPQGLVEYDKTALIKEEDNPEAQNPAHTETPGSHYWVKYPYKYNFTIDEPNKCEQRKPFLVVMVPVAAHNREHRDIIRSTWGNVRLIMDKVIQHYFMLGQHSGEGADQIQEQLLEENKEHGDLIQSDFIESYNNLTIKTMMMLEWLDLRCPNTSYVIKIDSDMFLLFGTLIHMLSNAPKTNYVTGTILKGCSVVRNPKSKWYLPKSEYPDDFYPTYPNGMTYIFSIDMVKKLLEASRHVRPLFLEDVYIGMCMQYLNISMTEPGIKIREFAVVKIGSH